MPRLFLAASIPAELRQAASNLITGIPNLRVVRPADMHLTLRFIGEVDESLLPQIGAELSLIRQSAITLRLLGVGTFPKPQRATVLWVGFSYSPELLRLQQDLEAAVVRSGGAPDPKPFKPHLTLARSREPQDVRNSFIEPNSAFQTEPFLIEAFHLIQSTLRPSGPEYVIRESYSLN